MELTEKCKEDFEEWFTEIIKLNTGWFDRLPKSMQYGVYVDFFDSLGLIVESQRCLSGYKYYVTDTPNFFQAYNTKTRPQARTKVIEKANKIYNNK